LAPAFPAVYATPPTTAARAIGRRRLNISYLPVSIVWCAPGKSLNAGKAKTFGREPSNT
jgi:hypothetical protein